MIYCKSCSPLQAPLCRVPCLVSWLLQQSSVCSKTSIFVPLSLPSRTVPLLLLIKLVSQERGALRNSENLCTGLNSLIASKYCVLAHCKPQQDVTARKLCFASPSYVHKNNPQDSSLQYFTGWKLKRNLTIG